MPAATKHQHKIAADTLAAIILEQIITVAVSLRLNRSRDELILSGFLPTNFTFFSFKWSGHSMRAT
jgi:hypothetical protein